jgi:hypothetical protein
MNRPVQNRDEPGSLIVADAGNGAELGGGWETTMQNEIRQPLLEPYMLGDLQLRNRVVMAPLTSRAPRIRGTCPPT